MTFRPLIIGPPQKSKIQKVLDFARQRENWYDLDGPIPGFDRRFQVVLDTYRCVFSYTKSRQGFYRHLTVSIPDPTRWPHPAAVWMIADAFGFIGWDEKTIDKAPDGWLVNMNQQEHCIVVAQEVDPATL
jgi:hypothetical protein